MEDIIKIDNRGVGEEGREEEEAEKEEKEKKDGEEDTLFLLLSFLLTTNIKTSVLPKTDSIDREDR